LRGPILLREGKERERRGGKNPTSKEGKERKGEGREWSYFKGRERKGEGGKGKGLSSPRNKFLAPPLLPSANNYVSFLFY